MEIQTSSTFLKPYAPMGFTCGFGGCQAPLVPLPLQLPSWFRSDGGRGCAFVDDKTIGLVGSIWDPGSLD